jgi:cytochrome b561
MNSVSVPKYPALMRLLHWLMALIIFGLIGLGWYMSDLPKEDANRAFFYTLHKSFGIIALLLVTLRVLVRLMSVVPPLPGVFLPSEKKIIYLGHALLYVLMFLIPLSGYLMSCAAGKGVKLFGYGVMCVVAPHEVLAGIMNETHEVAAYVLGAVVIAHALAAIRHARDPNSARNVMLRMK